MAIDPRIANPMIANIAGNAFAPIEAKRRQEMNALAQQYATPMNLLGKGDQNALAGYDGTSAQAMPLGDAQKSPKWLRYANQNATRDDPLADEFVRDLSFLADLGVEIEVFSGGQENNTTHGTGSNRHTGGFAADAYLLKNGRRLDPSNPNDLPIYQEIARQAKARGMSLGAGEGYMRPGSIHIGYGQFGRKEPPTIWGRSGKGEYAAPWLKSVWNG